MMVVVFFISKGTRHNGSKMTTCKEICKKLRKKPDMNDSDQRDYYY